MHHAGSDEHPPARARAGAVIWLTGLSGAGKSTLAQALARELHELGHGCYVLDGDVLRTGLNADLGFSPEDRHENIRRTAEVAALFADAGLICITALISPYRAGRATARQACKAGFHEVHVKADLATCEARDPKGLYRRARAGELPAFTGIDAPYEVPERPELVVETTQVPLAIATAQLLAYVQQRVLHQPQ
ncbi:MULTISPECIES: adenylyl-sulfate kinase [unclassified Pseudomonas]|uniref:adenylyl-sulfate kinase n=1 Tax=unclassified Pseudomonas TaxID=196821 RepID=UPI000C888C05|nr:MULTISPECIES: adenylyl-sulfate kinase [unclassified Pseudomonas]PMZ94068.1 adenylyl-sulfate kinase [Pseudomonas sp. FW305-42]PNA25063.1 adenylyl-sulfate kinase [Pseudomonas sp. MPR-R1B]PNB26453.1 adenylyl-sulfate kinase [Pseudomonas sp. DP16D-E2]PNB42180.1 adenylyl-sulfate kinase [Pseudomonas sp. FW305-17]PNB62026.1 adenylyl-sulfate kinase [Pseudomonas sp. GW531-E2]